VNISGILVIAPGERLGETIQRLNALPGVEVHHTDPNTGRIVVTQEAATVQDEVDGLKRIKALPHIVLAEMVHHHFEDSSEVFDHLPDSLQDAGELPEVPAFLRNRSTAKGS
jgi:nitrate reductase NapD